MPRILGIIGALLCILSLVGCGKPEDRFIGKWSVNTEATSKSIEAAADTELQKQQTAGKKVTQNAQKDMTEFWTAVVLDAKIEIDIRADKSFVTTQRGKVDEQGHWSVSDNKIVLTPTEPKNGKSTMKMTGSLTSGQLWVKMEEGVDFDVVFDPAN